MCGIAGIISFKESVDAKMINRMTDIVSYRGPDDEGAIIVSEDRNVKSFKRAEELNPKERKGRILLGHRRLSIIDLTVNGHQPMSYANETLWITFNGEIYNYIELREELEKYSYTFKTKTDTEVILAAYHKWSEDCITKFNGMWSFAILDLSNNLIFCSTDQFNIKPFYYLYNSNGFYFGSEIKQLLELPWIERKLNKEYILNTFGYNLPKDYSDITLTEGIKQINTGYKIIIQNVLSNNPGLKIVKWHEFDTKPSLNSISEKQAIEKFSELFYDSVKLRLRSDVPVGTALSGGLDSSAIVVTMDKLLKESGSSNIQKTFTAGSEMDEIDETRYAKEVLNLTNAKGFFTIPTADGFFSELEKMYFHIELPYLSTSCYASWCVYKLAKESGVTVTLDGQGADEILAGYDIYMYPYYQTEFFSRFYLNQIIPNSKQIKYYYQKSCSQQFKEIVKKNIKSIKIIDKKYELKRFQKENIFNEDFINECKEIINDDKDEFHFNNKYFPFINSFSIYLRNTFYTISLPLLLSVVDRNSMAHSIEARVPFLDYRLMDFVYSLPHNYKINKGITKYLLRKSFENMLPKNTIVRKKLGFVTAEKEWFENKKSEINNYLQNNDSLIKHIFNESSLERIFDFNYPENNGTNSLWKVLSLAVLIKLFKLNY